MVKFAHISDVHLGGWKQQPLQDLNFQSFKKAIDIWIGEEQNLNKGYGTIMMKLAIDRCFKDTSIDGILIDPLKSNVKAQRFYQRLGFEFIEEREFDGTTCVVYELKRKRPAGK